MHGATAVVACSTGLVPSLVCCTSVTDVQHVPREHDSCYSRLTRASRSGVSMHMDYTAMITYRARVPSFFSLSAVGIACRNYI